MHMIFKDVSVRPAKGSTKKQDLLNPDGFRVIASSPDTDSYGDTVRCHGFSRRHMHNGTTLPVLFGHDTKTIVGQARDFGVVDDNLECTIVLAAAGTSPQVDMVRALSGQGMIDGVSLGFMAGKATPRDTKDPYGGLVLEEITPMEVSLTAIPANPKARIKELETLGRFAAEIQVAQSAANFYHRSAYAQMHDPRLQVRDLTSAPIPTSNRSKTTMSLADRIKAKQAEILKFRDQIATITNDLDATGDMSDEQSGALEEVNAKLESAVGHLKRLEETEAVLARASGAAPDKPDNTLGAPRIVMRDNRPKGARAFATIAALAKGFALRQDPVEVARQAYPGQPDLEHLVRAATAPATTTGANWATNLVRETWGEMIELLRAVSVYPRVPGMRVDLSQTLNLPVQNGRGALAAGFVAENGAIPVKEGSIGTTSLTPKKLGVISAFSKELMRRSIPAIESVIQSQVLADTAEGLDTALLDAVARSATRPAGLRDATETGAGNINAVTNVATGAHGSTVAEILLDVDTLLARAEAVNASGGAWIMNPAQVRGLRNKQDATTGHFVFRDSIDAGLFEGVPILQSTNVTAGIVVYVAEGAMGFGEELAPYFEQSDQATLHFENASPLAIGTVATPNTVAAPTISLFQQDLVAIKAIWTLDWRILRQAGVQVLTAATGW